MEWKEVKPKQKNWQKQWDLTAYYGSHTIGTIVLDDENNFNCIIDNNTEFLESNNLNDAKEDFYERLDTHISGEIDYYKELQRMLNKIKLDEKN